MTDDRENATAVAGSEIELSIDVLLRLSAILGIHGALSALFEEQPKLARAKWAP
jgi:hypothetical protein